MSTNTTVPSWRPTMAFVQVQCPDCYSTDVVQYGKQANGTQRYRCDNPDGPRIIVLLQYQDKGRLPAVRQPIVDMTLNGSGVRDIVRVLRVSSATVIDVLKKKRRPSSRSMKDCSTRLLLRKLTLSFGKLMPPRWMKCGTLWGAKASSGGCGTRLI